MSVAARAAAAPGDLIFSGVAVLAASEIALRAMGTPAGVGSARRRDLAPGDLIETEIAGLGRLLNRCVAG